MKTVFEHVEHIKGKPHHIRKRVAFATAAGTAGLIALVWMIGSISLGTLAVQNTSFADAAVQAPVIKTGGTGTSGLAGAAAALENKNAPAHIEIVDTTPKASATPKVEQTTLPF